MSTTKLILHHRYSYDVAHDWSGRRNQGRLVSASTGGGPGPLQLYAGASRVEVAPSSTLRDFGELRIRVVFHAEPDLDGPRRYNLVEGEYAFALFVESDGALAGTVNSPTAGWVGPRSAPGSVAFGRWHTADLIHDGISHARLYLDGVLVAERWDAAGPLRRTLGARGVWIGHWPGDDRYTFRGELAEVQIWVDDPNEDAGRAIDDCCLDTLWIDRRVDEARSAGWGPDATRDSIAALFDQMRAAAAEVRGGSASTAATISTLTQQSLNAIATGDGTALLGPVGVLWGVIQHNLGPQRAHDLGRELHDALRATPAGLLMGSDTDELVTFLREVADRTCLGGLEPPGRRPPEPRPPTPPDVDPDRPDHDTDVDGGPPAGPAPSGEKPEEPPPGLEPPPDGPIRSHPRPPDEIAGGPPEPRGGDDGVA